MSDIRNLALQGLSIEQLRGLTKKHFGEAPDGTSLESLDRDQLIETLSSRAALDPKLAETLKAYEIAFRPTFYVMALSRKGRQQPVIDRASLQKVIKIINENARKQAESGPPSTKGFKDEDVVEHEGGVVELYLTWRRIHHYWKPGKITRKHLYEARFGIVILDFAADKALLACNTKKERDVIVEAFKTVYGIRLSPLVLNKDLLNQIGDFSMVRRASYFVHDRYSQTQGRLPANITYADARLSGCPVAQDEEQHPRSQRKQSYYRIPLAGQHDQCVGASSDSGKLWIPGEIPLSTIRDFGLALLKKLSGALDEMAARGEIENVLDSLGIRSLPVFADLGRTALREEVYRLVVQLILMILHKKDSSPFAVSPVLAADGVPALFNYPRLEVTDPETGDTDYWTGDDGCLQFLRFFQRKGIPHLRVHPTREELNLKAVTHPITGMPVAVTEPLARLQLVPTEKLLFTITEALQHAATQFAALKEVVWTPFHIRANVLYLDVQRALGTPTTHRLGIEVAPDDVKEFQKPMQRTVAPAAWEGLRDQLRALGEKCRHMEDHTCTSCVSDKRFLCLRSLTGHFLMRPFILAHKGIELSDLQADLHVGDERLHVFGFAKQSSSKTSGLTARNKNGAILLAQVLMQVERQAFDTAVIISPSTINEDLRERLQVVCGVFGKRLLILDEVALAKLYLAFEGYARYVGISVEEMIRASSKESQRAA